MRIGIEYIPELRCQAFWLPREVAEAIPGQSDKYPCWSQVANPT